MGEVREELKKYIEGFDKFSAEDKQRWIVTLENLSLDYVLFLCELFETSPDDIVRLNESLKEKQEILDSQDVDAWKKLVEHEKEELITLSSKE